MEANDYAQLSEELIQRLGSGGDLGEVSCGKRILGDCVNLIENYFRIYIPEGMITNELFQQGDFYITNQDDSNSNVAVDNEIIMHMDIREPLRTLQ